MKFCSICQSLKDYSDFYVDRSKSSGCSTYCKECSKAKGRQRYSDDPKSMQATAKVWYQNNQATAKKNQAGYYIAHRDELRKQNQQWVENNRDRNNALHQRWHKEHREESRAIHQRARAKRHLTIDASDFVIDPMFIAALLMRQEGSCNICPRSISQCYQTDHVVPLSRGGPHTAENIQLLCEPCNSHKASFLMSELPDRPYFREFFQPVVALIGVPWQSTVV